MPALDRLAAARLGGRQHHPWTPLGVVAPCGGHLAGTMKTLNVREHVGSAPEGESEQRKSHQDDNGNEKV